MLARFFEIRTKHPAAAAMFRDFQSVSDDDLRSLLDDLEELISSGDS
jgi:predicted phosphoribosyltransferase